MTTVSRFMFVSIGFFCAWILLCVYTGQHTKIPTHGQAFVYEGVCFIDGQRVNWHKVYNTEDIQWCESTGLQMVKL